MIVKIKKNSLPLFISSLTKKYEVFAPTGYRFEKIKSFEDVSFGKTIFSAKKLFLPSREEIFSFRDNKISVSIKAKKRVLFGLRPCDLNAISYLDLVFSANPYYAKRRENIILLGIQCKKQFENCYCDLTNSFESDNYDLLFIESGSNFFVKTGSERGKRLVKSMNKVKEVNEDGVNKLMGEIRKKFRKKSSIKINDKIIPKLSRDCFNCGVCNSVCPTCHCFTIEDRLSHDMKSGKRVREWDSCQLQRFTRVAGDFVFRKEREQRVRNRIYCKFKYSKENYGMMSCTGCGRCVDACTKKIDIFKVFG